MRDFLSTGRAGFAGTGQEGGRGAERNGMDSFFLAVLLSKQGVCTLSTEQNKSEKIAEQTFLSG